MVTRREQIADYDRVFRRFFLDETDTAADIARATIRAATPTQSVLEIPATEPVGRPTATTTRPASGTWRPTPTSSQQVVRRMHARRTGGSASHHEADASEPSAAVDSSDRRLRRAGDRLDMRRMIRETMRAHGEPAELYRRRRRRRLRPLVLILDVSGSMSDYSRNLLQFAYSTRRAASRVEVFCFGTRLTRITKALADGDPTRRWITRPKAVFDWEGGTRIGDSLTTFVRDFGRRGMSRGAIVVICSDGLDRGDPAVLACGDGAAGASVPWQSCG